MYNNVSVNRGSGPLSDRVSFPAQQPSDSKLMLIISLPRLDRHGIANILSLQARNPPIARNFNLAILESVRGFP
jgi:hypothetical protein